MDLDLTPTKSAEEETELDDTPPHDQSRSTKNHHPPPPVVYKECMKNHAATLGSHAVDGCGEYMPPTSADPTTLICAACGCHRNFHRRDSVSPTAAITPPFLDFRRPGPLARTSSSPSPPRPPLLFGPHALFALSTAVADRQEPLTPTAENPSVGRKRFRTKFSSEQKKKMHSFSEKVGWKMPKSDDAAVEEFCRDVGVAKGVLKVWMHNNKKTIIKKETSVGGIDNKSMNGEGEGEKSEDDENESGGRVRVHDSNNGSSSSA